MNIIDIVLKSEPRSICNINVIQPFGTIDDSQVILSLFNDCIDEVDDATVKHYDWANADYDGMSDYLSGID